MTVRSFLGAMLSLLLIGCGLADYENRMRTAQEELKDWEEKTKVLGGPLVPPSNKEGSPLLNLFGRPPRGLNLKQSGPPRLELFYDYVPERTGAADPFVYLSIAFGSASDGKLADKVMATFHANKAATRKTVTIERRTRPKVTITQTEFDDERYTYSVNQLVGSKSQAILVYVFDKKRKGVGNSIVQLSLRTFGVDSDADEARKENERGDPIERVRRPLFP